MQKTVELNVPVYLKKFLVREFDGTPEGVITADRHSEIGRTLHLASRVIPFTPEIRKITGTKVTFNYGCRDKCVEIGPDKLPDLERQLDSIFRRTLIAEVRSIHGYVGGEYWPVIRAFVERYDIRLDTDISSDMVRKIYRDYLDKTDKQHRKKNQKTFA